MKACARCQMRYPNDTKFCFVDGSDLVALPDPRIGTTIAGRYVVEEMVGEGGMASVYRARHKLVDRPCAIKVMSPALARDPVVRERFRREAKSAQKLAHPNIIEIFDQGETEDGTTYIAMELLKGSSLADLILQGPIPIDRALGLMIQIARGIARAHDLEVIHRDLKPENIFVVAREDGTDLVKLLDFGIARSRSDSRLTNAGELFGTPQYMAPERMTNHEAGASVDLYALGVIYFEMLTAKLPFDAPDVATLLVKHMKDPPPSPRVFAPLIPPVLEQLILGLLAKDPKDRPVGAHRVRQDLMELAVHLGAPVPPEPEEDPASLQMQSAPLPSISIDRWGNRMTVFEDMMEQAFEGRPSSAPLSSGGPSRAELGRMLGELRTLVHEAQALRFANLGEQRKLEDIQFQGREGRQRLGFAVDALGIDASHAKEEVRASVARAEEASARVGEARALYIACHGEVTRWEGRSAFQEPYEDLVTAYRNAADLVTGWLETRDRERLALRGVEEKERLAHDLDFQIRELRTALANHEKTLDAEQAEAEQKVIANNARAEELERKLLSLATRFCEPLRRKPELAPLFHALEAEAAHSRATT